MRRGRKRGAAPGEAAKCRMCGRAVAVGSDGRCALGHFVGFPEPEVAADPPPQPEVDADPVPGTDRAGAPDTVAGTATVPLTPVGDPGPPPAARPEPAPAAVAAAPPPPAGPAPRAAAGPAPAPVNADMFADVSSLDDLGSIDDLGAYGDLGGFHDLDAYGDLGSIEDLGNDLGAYGGVPDPAEGTAPADLFADLGGHPAGASPTTAPHDAGPPQPTPPRPRTPDGRPEPPGIDALLGWDVTASALDAELPAPSGAAELPAPPLPAPPAAAEPPAPPGAPEDAGSGEEPAHEAAIVQDEAALDAEDRRIARRRALGILGGTIAAVATIVGSILALPL